MNTTPNPLEFHRGERRERELADRLAQIPNAEPPADLLAKLYNEIPEAVEIHPSLVANENDVEAGRSPIAPTKPRPTVRRWTQENRWLLAASLVAMLGAGWFAIKLQKGVPDLAASAASGSPSDSQELDRVGKEAGSPSSALDPNGASEAPRLAEADAVAAQAPESVAAAVPESEVQDRDELRILGYLGSDRADADGTSMPAEAPAAPSLLDKRVRQEAGAATTRERRPQAPAEVPPSSEMGVEEGVEGGIPGGVVGGVPGGSPGGVLAGVPSPAPPPPSALRVAPKPSPERKRDAAKAKLERSSANESAAAAPSTGGEAEPNDQPYGDVFFEHAGVNPFIDVDEDALSTFALDVDTGSYTVVRRYLDDGHLPPAAAVRVEEMVNFFDYRDAAPTRGDFAIHLEGAPSPYGPKGASGERYRLLRVGIKAREVSADRRKPAVLTFVVDVSGSMDQENRLELVKSSLGLLLGELKENDRVGLVVYGTTARTILEPTSDKRAIREAIARLVAEGSTNAEAGLTLAYDVAARAFDPRAANRLILCSDGVANVGATGPQSILARIDREARRGIELTTVGFGMGNYNDVLMEKLADQGDGRYAYVDSLDEARRIFVEGLAGTLQTVAKDAKVQVEFDSRSVASYRLLGYENRDVADERFRDDSVDAGELGAGHEATALYEVKLQPWAAGARGAGSIAKVSLRWQPTSGGRPVQEMSRDLRLSDLSANWRSAPRGLRLAGTVVQFAEILRGSYWAKGESLEQVVEEARGLVGSFGGDRNVSDFANLVGKAARLARR